MPSKRQKLVSKLDTIFSQYIRLRNTNRNGYADCFTCGTNRHWREVDAGHFMSRGCFSTRWNEKNVQFQCKRCNGFRSGEQFIYSKQLDAIYGQGTADELLRLSKQTQKFSQYELEDMIRYYTKKVNELKQEKGI